MKAVKLVIFAVVLVILVSSSVLAETWNGLTIGSTYTASIPEYYTGVGYYSGVISQYASLNTSTGFGYNKIAGGGSVYYSLPKIMVTNGPTLFGVCIDTNEYTGSPLQLRKGWEAAGDPLDAGNNASRFNGTVKDEDAWKHTTYLFNQHGLELQTWWGAADELSKKKAAAFQLAIWEVMSGDGLGGANWDNGYFTATGLGTGLGSLSELANDFVAAAYGSRFANWEGSSSALYFHDHQDFLVYAPTTHLGGNPSVPEIPAYMLAPLGLAAFGFIRRRFIK